MTTTFATKFRAREPTVGTWLTLADPAVAELSGGLAFDAAVIDAEHTPNSLETITDLIRAVELGSADSEADETMDTAALVRVSENDPTDIKRVLDAGARGVMAPMIDTAAAARELVEATRYPPEGVRGIGLGRATEYGRTFPDAVRDPADPVTIAQIETEAGLANAADIAAVDGLDGLFVGPADLSAALGIVGELEHERFLDAVDRVLEAGRAVEKPVAMLALNEDDVERWLDRGFDMVVAGVDINYVRAGSRDAIATFEDAAGNGDE